MFLTKANYYIYSQYIDKTLNTLVQKTFNQHLH